MKNIYAVRAFGWQLDWRTNGWLPLSVRPGFGHNPAERARWRILPLGRFGCVTFGRMRFPKGRPGTVTVTLEADTTAFVAAMRRAHDDLHESASRHRFTSRIRRERALGMGYVEQLLDDWRHELGIERPDNAREAS